MSHRCVVRVDPQGQSMAVDILDTAGVSVECYESQQFSATRLTLPLTINRQTDFCVTAPGPYDVSCKVGGTEVADAGAVKRIQADDVPVLVVPDWPRELAVPVPTAASGVGAFGAFQGSSIIVGTDQQVFTMSELSGGFVWPLVPDIDVDNAANLLVAKAGTYLIAGMLTTPPTAATGDYTAYFKLNDDSVGPAFNFQSTIEFGTAPRHAPLPTLTLDLQVGDHLNVLAQASALPSEFEPTGFVTIWTRRLGDIPL